MNFGQLKTAVLSRGLNYLNDTTDDQTRLASTINSAYAEIVDADDWPFMLKLTNTTMPVVSLTTTLPQFKRMETMWAASRNVVLQPASRPWLQGQGYDLGQDTGDALFYYFIGDQLSVYPTDTGTFMLTYYASAATLTGDTDIPEIPARYHKIIVDLATYYLAEDADLKNFAKADFDAGMASMSAALINRQVIDQQVITDLWGDW